MNFLKSLYSLGRMVFIKLRLRKRELETDRQTDRETEKQQATMKTALDQEVWMLVSALLPGSCLAFEKATSIIYISAVLSIK